MSTTTTPTTAIVIGGGPAGLLAAAQLADAGVGTTLLEARAGLGGRAASESAEGLFLNQGPHALYVGGPGMRELRALGVDPPGWNPTSLLRSVFVRDGEVRRRPGGGIALARWVAAVVRGDASGELAGLSVNAWLDSSLDGAARDAAAALIRVTTFVADHECLSADVAALQIRIGLRPGVRYLRGGWQSLVDALAVAAQRRGAALRTRARVRRLDGEAGDWRIALEDEELSCDAVIVANGGPDAVGRLLGDEAPLPSGPPVEVSTLDLGLRSLPRPMRRFALGLDEPTYLSRHSPPEQRRTHLLSLMSYERADLGELEALADVLQPGWRHELTLHRHLPRMVAVSALATPQTGGLAGRPGVEVRPGLFAAGDWIGPEGWLSDASLASAAAAARAAARIEASTGLAA
jgi:phytoene dehydrogenase-like protein